MLRPVLLHMHPDERIILVLRRHWFVFLGHVVTATVVGALFTAIVLWANAYLNDLIWRDVVGSLGQYGWIFVLVSYGIPLAVAGQIIREWLAMYRSSDRVRLATFLRQLLQRLPVILVGTFLTVLLADALLAFLLIDVVAGHPLPSIAGQSVSEHLGRGVLLIATSMYALALILYLLVAWMDYYLDVFIVTNRQIVNIQQMILIGQKVTETNFQQIQNSYSKVSGLLLSLLDIGTVFVETAGERENFQFNYVRHPGYVTKTILEIQQQQWEYGNIVENMDEARDPQAEVRPFEYRDYLKSQSHGEHRHHPTIAHTPHHVSDLAAPAHTTEAVVQKKELIFPDGRLTVEEGVIWSGETAMAPEVEQLLNLMDQEKNNP